MEFVVNEWLPEYFKPNASNDEKEKLEKFLNRFLGKEDKIYVRRPSEFLRKILRYAKDYQDYPKVYENIHKFITVVLLDSNRCSFIDENEFQLQDHIRAKLIEGGNTESDAYLFEAASMTENKIIVTTDKKLKDWMEEQTEYKIELLDDFLANY